MLLFSVACSQNENGRGEVGLGMTGISIEQETVRWQQRSLSMGDEVRVKIIDAQKVDAYEVMQKAPRDVRKYEKAACRRMAKEFGWTIVTGRRKAPIAHPGKVE